MKVYLINQYDRWCPENNNGDYITTAFSTRELAEAYCNKHDPKNEKGKRDSDDGLSIRELILDEDDNGTC